MKVISAYSIHGSTEIFYRFLLHIWGRLHSHPPQEAGDAASLILSGSEGGCDEGHFRGMIRCMFSLESVAGVTDGLVYF